MTKNLFKHFIEFDNISPFFALAFLIYLKLSESTSNIMTVVAMVLLGISVMTAVHNAETIAHKIGETLGTLVLAISVTVIEVGLIVSIMSANGPGAETIARDTIFAAVMIITNGIVGLCLILGGLKFKEQVFHLQGSYSLLTVLLVLSIMIFVLPNHTVTTTGPSFSSTQHMFIAGACILLYVLCVFFQTKTHKGYFNAVNNGTSPTVEEDHDVSKTEAWVSFFALLVSLVAVIGLAKQLSPTVEKGVHMMGAPESVVGLIIATIVLLPEALAAINSARSNRLQISLNLALGSGIASIALTIPIVIGYVLYNGRTLVLGVDPKDLTFMIMSFLTAMMTLGTGKVTLIQGAVHAVILLTFFVLSFVP